jgi:uncharacterized membrane protein YbhN (UPF0104 family)
MASTGIRRRLGIAVGVAALAIAGLVLYGERAQLAGTGSALAHATLGLLVVGAALEVCSDIGYALMTWYLVADRGPHVSRRWFFGVSLAAIAMNDSIPLGAGFSTAYVFRKLRTRDTSIIGATAGLLAGNLMAIAALLVMLGIVVLVHAPAVSVLDGLDEAFLGVLLVAAVLGIVLVDRVLVACLGAALWFLRRLGRDAPRLAAQREMARRVRYSRAQLAKAGLAALANWVFDLAALFLSLAAVHAHVGIFGVVAAYVLGALAANLPITPGGLGVVEGSITVALVAFGGAPSVMLAAVLLYRVVSYWIWIPIGWASYFGLGGLDDR